MFNKQLKPHSISNMYPMMQKKEYENLLNSIDENGYDESQPIVLYNEQILDGRNRYQACIELDIEPKFKMFNGTDEEALEESRRLNSYRRHLENDQRAMCAAFEVIQSRENKGKLTIPFVTELHAVSSQRQVERAIQIVKYDKKIANNVFEGKMRIHNALETIEHIENLKNPPENISMEYGSYEQTSPAIEEYKNLIQLNNNKIQELTSSLDYQKSSLQMLEEENKRLKEDCGKKAS